MKCRRHVEVKRFVELVVGTQQRRPRQRSTRVVHEKIDPAEFLERPLGETIELCIVEHVRRHDERAASVLLDDACNLAKRVLAPGGQHDVGPGLGKRDRNPSANTPAGARHDCDASVNPKAVQNHVVAISGAYSRAKRPKLQPAYCVDRPPRLS
jgi:hypothetical protein